MDKFLIELLQLSNSVILPDFGAIVIANENTGDVMFDEYLKFNDGKLIALIVANSTMDEQDATNMVAKYVRDIQIQLDKGDSYDIFGLGSFTKDQDGTIVFNGSIKTAEKSAPQEFMGPSPTPVAPSEEKKETAPLSKLEEPKEETPDNERPELDLSTVTVSAQERSLKEETIVPAKKTSAPSVKAPIQKEIKKRGVLFWVLIFLLLVLSGGGIFVGIKYEEVKNYLGWNVFEVDNDSKTSRELKNSSVDSKEIQTKDLIETEVFTEDTISTELEDEQVLEEEETRIEEEPIEETIEEQPTSGNSYHIIGGSFSSAENAGKFATELQSKGWPARVLGQFNGLHMVSVKSFSSQGDAFAELKNIQEQAPDAWLFKYPK